MALEQQQSDVICVHCRKPFRSEILAPNSELAGFKCPHCQLYMPLERAEPDEGPAAADATL